jgi:hypothetical protein
LFQSFSISPKDLPRILFAAAQWALLELREGWRSWFQNSPTATTRQLDASLEAAAKNKTLQAKA